MKRVLSFQAIFSLLLCAPTCLHAELEKEDNAAIEKLVTDAIKAQQESDWKKHAEMLHRDELNEFKETLTKAIRKAGKDNPDRVMQILGQYFNGTKDADKLLKMTASEMYISMIKGSLDYAAQNGQTLKVLEIQIIGTVHEKGGTVHEKGGTAHVVIRATLKVSDSKVTRVAVQSVKRDNNSWRLLLAEDVRSLIEEIRSALQSKE